MLRGARSHPIPSQGQEFDVMSRTPSTRLVLFGTLIDGVVGVSLSKIIAELTMIPAVRPTGPHLHTALCSQLTTHGTPPLGPLRQAHLAAHERRPQVHVSRQLRERAPPRVCQQRRLGRARAARHAGDGPPSHAFSHAPSHTPLRVCSPRSCSTRWAWASSTF